MKEIKNYTAKKYNKIVFPILGKREYKEIEPGIYEHKDDNEILYVTSLSFEQEPEFDEGEYADDISQYPLEDLLDEFNCHISDLYYKLNTSDSKICYLEFAAMEVSDIKNLRGIIGKHVYNKSYGHGENESIALIIE